MGRKKRRSDSEKQRIFCYYCERNFGTEQTLLSHQKEKHLRCPSCNKRMISISGLVIHSQQVHNVTVNSVPNAMEGRTNVAVDVVGMNGIPASYYAQQTYSTAKVPRLHGNNSAGTYAAQQYYAAPNTTPYVNAYAGAQSYAGAYGQTLAYGNGQVYGTGYPALNYGYAARPHTDPYYAQAARASATQHPIVTPQATTPSTAPLHTKQPLSGASAGTSVSPTVVSKPMTSSAPVSYAAAPTTSTAALSHASGPKIVSTATTPKQDKKPQQVKIIFDKLEVSMEELRAKLPRYRLKH